MYLPTQADIMSECGTSNQYIFRAKGSTITKGRQSLGALIGEIRTGVAYVIQVDTGTLAPRVEHQLGNVHLPPSPFHYIGSNFRKLLDLSVLRRWNYFDCVSGTVAEFSNPVATWRRLTGFGSSSYTPPLFLMQSIRPTSTHCTI